MKTMELGVCSIFFLEQIHGGAAGVGCVWRRKFEVGLFFWIWSCVELSQTRPTPDDGQGYLVAERSFLPLIEETGFGSDTPPNVFRAAFHHTTLIRLFTH
jgi:hypothetical protein